MIILVQFFHKNNVVVRRTTRPQFLAVLTELLDVENTRTLEFPYPAKPPLCFYCDDYLKLYYISDLSFLSSADVGILTGAS